MTPKLRRAVRLLERSRLELIEQIRKDCGASTVGADAELERDDRGRAALVEHLRRQARATDLADAEARFTDLVLGKLDHDGRLDLRSAARPDGTRRPDLTIEDLATEAGLDPENALDVLRRLQRMEPVGACARDLRECLLVQAEALGLGPLEIAILDAHFDDFERHDHRTIARDLSVPLERVYGCVMEIWKLAWRPGRGFRAP